MKSNRILILVLVYLLGMGCSQMKKQEKLVQEVEYQLLDTIGRVKKIEEYKHEIESFKEKWKMSERDSFESAEGGGK